MNVGDIGSWLTGLGLTTPVLDGYFLAPSPDRAVFVTFTGGPGSKYERTFDDVTFQVRARGLQRNPDDAEILARQVDDLILGVVPPTTIGSEHVIDVDRTGAPPRFADRDSAFRSEWICNYQLTVARTVF